MDKFGLVLLVVVALWGWVAVLPLAVLLIVWSLVRSVFGGGPWQGKLVGGIILLLFAIAWQQAVLQYNFGRTIGVVTTQDRSREAEFRLTGARSYSWKIETASKPTRYHLNGRPKQAFWMRNNTSLGVEYHHGFRDIVNVDLIAKATHDAFHLTAAEENELRDQNSLTPQELAEFEAELAQAAHSGALWIDGG